MSERPHTRIAVFPRLQTLARALDVTGAKAASFTVTYFPRSYGTDDEKRQQQFAWAEAYKQMLSHPALPQLMLLDDNI